MNPKTLVLGLIFAIFLIPITGSCQQAPQERGEILETVLTHMESAANDTTLTAERCFTLILRRGISACDQYAGIYVTQESRDNFKKAVDGTYSGVGMYVMPRDDKFFLNPFAGSPADSAGIQDGDVLISVDSVRIGRNVTTAEVVEMITGPPGTSVSITVFRDGQAVGPLNIQRQDIEVDFVSSDTINSEIGYIRIERFSRNIFNDFGQEVSKLEGYGVKGLIIDLRGNPGGRLGQTLSILERYFSPKSGSLMITEMSRGNVGQVYATRTKGQLTNTPVVVLVNRFSASASEITAGVLQDWGVAEVVGNTTFGKGSVQSLFSDTTSTGQEFIYKFTIAEYRVGNSRSKVDGVGITPDYAVSDTLVDPQVIPAPSNNLEFDLQNDVQLNKALDLLMDKVTMRFSPVSRAFFILFEALIDV